MARSSLSRVSFQSRDSFVLRKTFKDQGAIDLSDIWIIFTESSPFLLTPSEVWCSVDSCLSRSQQIPRLPKSFCAVPIETVVPELHWVASCTMAIYGLVFMFLLRPGVPTLVSTCFHHSHPCAKWAGPSCCEESKSFWWRSNGHIFRSRPWRTAQYKAQHNAWNCWHLGSQRIKSARPHLGGHLFDQSSKANSKPVPMVSKPFWE